MRSKLSAGKKTILATLFWVAVWYALTAKVGNPLLLPAPHQVLDCLRRLMGTGAFWAMTGASIGRISLGVLLGVGLGTLLAVLTEASGLLDTLIGPMMTAMKATPVASFSILVLIWLDRDYVPVLICTIMVLPVIHDGVSGGIRGVDGQLLEMARAYRLPKRRILKRIYLPSVLPYFRVACGSALGLGWKAGIAAEVLTVPRHSMGRMISESKLYWMTEELFTWTLTVVLLSLLLQTAMQRLLRGRERHA